MNGELAGHGPSATLSAHAFAGWCGLDHSGVGCGSNALIVLQCTMGAVLGVRPDRYRTSLPLGRGAGHKVRFGLGTARTCSDRVAKIDERGQQADSAGELQKLQKSFQITSPPGVANLVQMERRGICYLTSSRGRRITAALFACNGPQEDRIYIDTRRRACRNVPIQRQC